MTPSQEFVIEHTDKCKKFIHLFRKLVTEKKFKAHVEKLHDNFAEHSNSVTNIDWYHILDSEIEECLLS